MPSRESDDGYVPERAAVRIQLQTLEDLRELSRSTQERITRETRAFRGRILLLFAITSVLTGFFAAGVFLWTRGQRQDLEAELGRLSAEAVLLRAELEKLGALGGNVEARFGTAIEKARETSSRLEATEGAAREALRRIEDMLARARRELESGNHSNSDSVENDSGQTGLEQPDSVPGRKRPAADRETDSSGKKGPEGQSSE